jgi:anti-sigma regulatory factor (Ser/Thr protein kinase)
MVSEEMLSNVVKYGGTPVPTIEVCVERIGTTLEIVISDDGVAFDPTAVPIPHLGDDVGLRSVGGLGLVIVRAMMDEVSYARVNACNRLTLRKALG